MVTGPDAIMNANDVMLHGYSVGIPKYGWIMAIQVER